MVSVFSMDKSRTVGQKKAGYQRDSFFLVPESVCQISIHSDSFAENYRGHRQRQRLHLTHNQGVSKSGDFIESLKVNVRIKSIPFSDENIKNVGNLEGTYKYQDFF